MKRGDIWHVDLNPVVGHEQRGRRFVLIVSADSFNKLMGLPVIVPITTGGEFARSRGFTVSMTGGRTQTSGVVLCAQPRTIDLKARGGKFIERAPDFIVDEVLARLAPLFE